MTAHGSEFAVELDPLIKEAKSRMRRRRVLIVSVVAVLLALGVALTLASRPGGPQGSRPGGGVTHSGSGLTQAQAGDRAESLLQTVTLPPGARPVSEQVASAAAAAPDYGTDPFTQYEYRHAFWQVPEPLASVMDFYRHHAHTPVGFSSGAVGHVFTDYQGTVFDGRFVGGRLENRILVSFVPSHGATIIRVDAGVPWTVPRPPSEVLPAAVREVDIRSSVPSHRWTRHVTDPREVALIRRWFNDLNVVQPNTTVSCASEATWPVQFTFRSASGGELAGALVPNYAASFCGEIQFTLHGERQTPLIDSTPFNGMAFIDRVQRRLELSLGPRIQR